jgi:hypothetical protein
MKFFRPERYEPCPERSKYQPPEEAGCDLSTVVLMNLVK